MKRILCLLLVFLLLPTLTPHATAANYTDVSRTNPDTAPYFNAIVWMKDNGYMNGTTSTTFSPNQSLTRAMFVTVLYAYAGKPNVSDFDDLPFKDVKKTDYFYKAVKWAYHYTLVTGTSATMFSPSQAVTYKQGLTILRKYAKSYKEYSLYYHEAPSDIPGYDNIDSYARLPVRWAVSNGLIDINGASPTAFVNKINSNIPRKDCARLINRLHTNVEGMIIGKITIHSLTQTAIQRAPHRAPFLCLQLITEP